MRMAISYEELVLTLMGSVTEYRAFDRQLSNITCDKTLFPNQWNRAFSRKACLKAKKESPP